MLFVINDQDNGQYYRGNENDATIKFDATNEMMLKIL